MKRALSCVISIACGCAGPLEASPRSTLEVLDPPRVAPAPDLRLTSLPRSQPRVQPPPQTRASRQPDPPSWFHPLSGPTRALPRNSSRKFGASRPWRRPAECILGHCGVDLGSTLGDPVFAIRDGLVERIERDATADPRSGRYIRLSHDGGTIVSRYIHLDTIRADLRAGDRVRGGEQIGTLGSTGIYSTGPHLHFSLSLRAGGRGQPEHYIDPEPLLRTWQLVEEQSSTFAQSQATQPRLQPTQPVTQPTQVATQTTTQTPAAAQWEPGHWSWSPGRWLWTQWGWAWMPPGWRWVPARPLSARL